METDARVVLTSSARMATFHNMSDEEATGLGAAPASTQADELSLPSPVILTEVVMTESQVEQLRIQISVFATLCEQLVNLHQASPQGHSSLGGALGRQHSAYDSRLMTMPNARSSARQRWTPSPRQLHILERLFELGSGTPSKLRIREITSVLRQHGQISETNVYNWFQNRKARAKRKQQLATHKDGESDVETDGGESPSGRRSKHPKTDKDSGQNSSSYGRGENSGAGQISDGVAHAYEQKPTSTDYFDNHESASTALSGLSERKPGQFANGVSLERRIVEAGTQDVTKVIVDGKLREVPAGLLDMRAISGDSKVLFNSHVRLNGIGHTDEAGSSIQEAENYRLSSLVGEAGPTRMVLNSSLVQNMQQV